MATNKPEIFTSKSRKPKVEQTKGGEFIERLTKKPYIGSYIKTIKGKYLAGTQEEVDSIQLERVRTRQTNGALLTSAGMAAALLVGHFLKKTTSADREKGMTKRYFVQDSRTLKVVETDKDTYQKALQELPERSSAEVDWLIKGPAEDREVNGYKFEGAESKNKKTIQALEKTIPGITTFITDYKYLVEDPAVDLKVQLSSDTIKVIDPEDKLTSDRKANFDFKN